MLRSSFVLMVGFTAVLAGTASAQSLGTFRWQLLPYCNVVSAMVTQNGAAYRIEGTDDQCQAGAEPASVVGMAFPRSDGSIGFGFTVVSAPGGGAVHVEATILAHASSEAALAAGHSTRASGSRTTARARAATCPRRCSTPTIRWGSTRPS